VWATEKSCYEFMARISEPGTRTLETGAGMSTALFAALGTEHTCVTPAAIEADCLRGYFAEKGISSDGVTFCLEPSHIALPQLDGEYDLVLIDGAHGFPMPILDWFFAARLLRRGGILVLDDVPLPAVGALLDFLEPDPRWELIERRVRWEAFRRLSDGPVLEGQWDQPFYRRKRPLARRVLGRARRELRARLKH
jgi:hypothetical protein